MEQLNNRTIAIKEKTRNKLVILKYKHKFKDYDAVINELLKNYENKH